MTLPASGPLSLTDIQTEFGGTNPIGMNEYYAGGGLVPAGTTGTFGAVPSSGTLSVQNFYGTSQLIPIYIEDVFSTYLYTGNGSTQTITNGIDLAGEGGLVWLKKRGPGSGDHQLYDTNRGATFRLIGNAINGQITTATGLTAFNSNGFLIGSDSEINGITDPQASWTFRKQPKFFDVVTYTGNGTSGRQISHSLGSVPGCVIVKRTDISDDWAVSHRSLTASQAVRLNTTDAAFSATTPFDYFNSTRPTSTVFTLGNADATNRNGGTFVAYLFAHNAGGFGLTGTDNVISCGSFTKTFVSSVSVSLGYEPQFVLIKQSDTAGDWRLYDVMRGMNQTSSVALRPNTSGTESDTTGIIPTATGFDSPAVTISGGTYIYIAIRRGPMKVPTTGTSVFAPVAANNSTGTVNTTGFPVDLQIATGRNNITSRAVNDRLRGVSTTTTESGQLLRSNTTDSEVSNFITRAWDNTGFQTSSGGYGGLSAIYWNFRRAPGFFDEVCYTGTGANRTVAHNLAAVPELMIVKCRSDAVAWAVYSAALGNTGYLELNTTGGDVGPVPNGWNSTTPTSTVFSLGSNPGTNFSGQTMVAYLFASCPGVSKVGSFTGTGATQVINCGFTGGARFVLIKATSTTGDWYVWDSARGIVAGNDPYLRLNSTAAEVTNTDWVDTAASGFELSNSGGNLANSNGVSYIFLAIS